MKTITLPFTCNQLKWSVLLVFPLMFIYGLFSEPIIVFIGMLFSVLVWVTQFLWWGFDGRFPQFKCRCDK